jgi:2'-5' RNA ligase
MAGALRLFIAVPLPEWIRAELARVIEKLDRETPPRTVRWVRAQGAHLTLKFLGDTSPDMVPRIESLLREGANTCVPFTIEVAKLGCFPSMRRPRVIWIGVQDNNDRILTLQRTVEHQMALLGYAPDTRSFSPHLTLGRLRQGTPRRTLAELGEMVARASDETVGTLDVSEFALVHSVLKPTGAEYTSLASFALRGHEE